MRRSNPHKPGPGRVLGGVLGGVLGAWDGSWEVPPEVAEIDTFRGVLDGHSVFLSGPWEKSRGAAEEPPGTPRGGFKRVSAVSAQKW